MIDCDREAERARTLLGLELLDTPPEREFDALAELAQRMLGTKTSAFTLVDAHRLWFKAKCGMPDAEVAREPGLCSWVVDNEQALVLPDACVDERFASNPFVLGDAGIRFYAGVPVHARSASGSTVPIGTICVIDDKPRQTDADDLAVLEKLACIAEALIEARSLALRAGRLAKATQEANERLERERRKFKQAERMASMGSWRLTIEDSRTEWSDGVYAIHDLPVDEKPSLEDALLFYPEYERDHVAQALGAAIATGGCFELDSDFVSAEGTLKRVRCMGEVENVGGLPVAVIGVIQDITERHRMETELLRSARTDHLTGLANRAEFDRVLDVRLDVAASTGDELAVLLIDLDGFKGLNDVLGHAMGDEALRRIAARLRAPYLDGCFAARLGGDEFAVIVPEGTPPETFGRIVDTLLRDLRIFVGEPARIVGIGGTIGCAWSGDVGGGRDDLLRCADAALYAAKRAGKGTISFHTDERRTAVQRKLLA